MGSDCKLLPASQKCISDAKNIQFGHRVNLHICDGRSMNCLRFSNNFKYAIFCIIMNYQTTYRGGSVMQQYTKNCIKMYKGLFAVNSRKPSKRSFFYRFKAFLVKCKLVFCINLLGGKYSLKANFILL